VQLGAGTRYKEYERNFAKITCPYFGAPNYGKGAYNRDCPCCFHGDKDSVKEPECIDYALNCLKYPGVSCACLWSLGYVCCTNDDGCFGDGCCGSEHSVTHGFASNYPERLSHGPAKIRYERGDKICYGRNAGVVHEADMDPNTDVANDPFKPWNWVHAKDLDGVWLSCYCCMVIQFTCNRAIDKDTFERDGANIFMFIPSVFSTQTWSRDGGHSNTFKGGHNADCGSCDNFFMSCFKIGACSAGCKIIPYCSAPVAPDIYST
jgi:hypothetical protein